MHNQKSESVTHIHCQRCGLPNRVLRWGIARGIGWTCAGCADVRSLR